MLFKNAFMIRSMIILTVILSSNFPVFGFKFKTGLHITIYYLSVGFNAIKTLNKISLALLTQVET